MAKIKSTAKAPPEISQASTADIAFLLLIFFISTTVFETEFGIPLLLPGLGSNPVKVKRENVMTLRATADGSVLVDDQAISLRDVRPTVETSLRENENLTISIETDSDAAYERMIDILDEVKAAKAPSISIKKRRG
jgi:biopolymer transport protein ExbD